MQKLALLFDRPFFKELGFGCISEKLAVVALLILGCGVLEHNAHSHMLCSSTSVATLWHRHLTTAGFGVGESNGPSSPRQQPISLKEMQSRKVILSWFVRALRRKLLRAQGNDLCGGRATYTSQLSPIPGSLISHKPIYRCLDIPQFLLYLLQLTELLLRRLIGNG